jgi:tetratricopeptide (TPR) repeat protein
MKKISLLVFLICISGILPSVSSGKDLPKIAVWDLTAGDINPSYAKDLTSILVSEISKLKKYEVYSQENVRTLAGWTAERMQLGCTDTKCLTALGQMDIAKLISGRVGKIGNRYSVSLNLFDTQNAKAENAVSEFGASEGELIDLVQVAVRKLLGSEIPLSELRTRQAIKDLDRAIELGDKSAQVYGLRGLALYRLGDHQQAIKDLDKAIELGPKFALSYVLRGDAYGKLGDHQQAIKDLNKAIELSPNFADAYFYRGVAYSRKNHYDEAIEDYNKAIEIKPNLASAYNNRGYVYINLENLQFAEKDFKKALELDASSDRRLGSYIGLAIVYFRQGKKEEAKNYYQEAIKINSLCKGGGEALEKEKRWFFSAGNKKTITEILNLFPSK